MPRFVVLRHETPPGYPRPSHFDLMLESVALAGDHVLRTWALASLPEGGQEAIAEELAAHRLAYLDFEGEIAAGRGKVTRVDAGEYATLEENDDLWRLNIAGQTFAGELTFVRSENDPQQWRITLG